MFALITSIFHAFNTCQLPSETEKAGLGHRTHDTVLSCWNITAAFYYVSTILENEFMQKHSRLCSVSQPAMPILQGRKETRGTPSIPKLADGEPSELVLFGQQIYAQRLRSSLPIIFLAQVRCRNDKSLTSQQQQDHIS